MVVEVRRAAGASPYRATERGENPWGLLVQFGATRTRISPVSVLRGRWVLSKAWAGYPSGQLRGVRTEDQKRLGEELALPPRWGVRTGGVVRPRLPLLLRRSPHPCKR